MMRLPPLLGLFRFAMDELSVFLDRCMSGLRPGRWAGHLASNTQHAGPELYAMMRSMAASVRDFVILQCQVLMIPMDNHGIFGRHDSVHGHRYGPRWWYGHGVGFG